MKFETEIFEPIEKTNLITRNQIGYLLTGIILIVLLVIYIYEELNNGITASIIMCSLIGLIILRLAQFSINKVPVKQIGDLEIDEIGIKINHQNFKLESLESIDFKFGDYRKKVKYRGKMDFRPLYSEGLNNHLKFKTNEGKSIQIQFKLKNKNHIKDLREFYIAAIKSKLIPLENSYYVLGLNNYKEIQEFKNKITSHNNG